MSKTTSTLLVVLLAIPGTGIAAVGDNSVGMNIHVGREGFIDACADLGVAWVRMDANWFQMEATRDVYDWTNMDTWVDRAHAAGLKVYMSPSYTPEWEARHGDTDGVFHNDVPDTSDEWVQFVHDAVAHFRSRGVTHFGIWNEANLTGFFEGTVQEYANIILIPGAAAVRTGCLAAGFTDCKVLGPDLANVGDCDVYLDDLLGMIPSDTFDIIAHHTYNGFVETGWTIFEGDSFDNALDSQRCPLFCRTPLRDVLDAHGWTGEVWITETGYRAFPAGDVAEEDLQAIYYTRVLEEQLERAWYTNTFFYEIFDCWPDQPSCDIDGFGIMKGINGSPGTRVYPDDYRRKPAFWALQQFIADHPEIVGTQPPPECRDGLDNDGDGLTDQDDRGCATSEDPDESDDPPREQIDCYGTLGLTIDGDLTDWGPDGWLVLGEESWFGFDEPLGPDDLEVRAAVRWSVDGLFVALEVTDDIHDNTNPPSQLWLGDSAQLGFDVGQSGGVDYDDQDDHEFNFALANGATSGYRHHGPAAATDDYDAVVVRDGTTTRYEIRLGQSALPGVAWAAGSLLGFSFLVNDADGAGRAGWIEWTPGIGMGKIPGYFGQILLLAETSGPDDQDGGVDADGGVDGGGDPGSDAGEQDAGDPDQDAGEQDAGADAGSDPGSDPGVIQDAGQDGAAGTDHGEVDPGGKDGCGCASTPARSGLPAAGLFLLVGVLIRRRPR